MELQELQAYTEGVRVAARVSWEAPEVEFARMKDMWVRQPRPGSLLSANTRVTSEELLRTHVGVRLACCVLDSLDGNPLPEVKTKGSAGYDCYARLAAPVFVGDTPLLIPLGFRMALPPGYTALLVGRSSLYRQNLSVQMGVIDSDYRGEVHAVVRRAAEGPAVRIEPGQRLVQMLIIELSGLPMVASSVTCNTARGEGGFGHTGD